METKLLNSIKKLMGKEYGAYANSLSSPFKKAFRVNTLKQSAADFKKLCPISLEPIKYSPDGFTYDSEVFVAAQSPFFYGGFYHLQDTSHFVGIEFLRPFVGKRVLDLCATPGAATLALASIMKNEGVLVCNDNEYNRARVLSNNVARTGITNALVTSNSPKYFEQEFESWFDTVVVNPPCSNEGLLKEFDGSINKWNENSVALSFARGYETLCSGAKALKVGGYLLYTTTALNTIENEEVINRFIATHDFNIVPVPKHIKSKVRSGIGIDAIRIYPQDKAEGFFACLMQKTDGGDDKEYEFCDLPSPHPTLANDVAMLLNDFSVISYGDIFQKDLSLVALTSPLPLKQGLNVLRAGLSVAELTKNGIVPSNALAMTLNQGTSINNVDLTLSDPTLREFFLGGYINTSMPFEGFGTVSLYGHCIGVIERKNNQVKSYHSKNQRYFIKG